MTHGGPSVRGELPWLGVSLCGILAAHAFSHFIIHRGAILTSLAATGTVPAWMWGALFAPELVACFIVGWRLTRWWQIGVYAVAAALVRQGCELALHYTGDAGHVIEGPRAVLLATPVVTLVYAMLIGLASSSGRQDRQLDRA
ncbi:hypothetical protein [Anaeromyxobacter terrae]|uniref:hypothetical protein n=1 Tax=Anaeromyxobacter terrae TaxID=2925406 RepID=UPI001F56FC25|nr:hypothetical protein [Anaeromyxobacter sp. SG22]